MAQKKLNTIRVSSPGRNGLNTQQQGQILDFSWATEAENAIIDISGRLAARQGFRRQNTGSGGGSIGSSNTVDQLFEYVDNSGNTLLIFASNNKIYKDDGDGTVTDISGSITTPTGNNWKFQNFNGKCIGFQDSHSPIVLSSTGGTFSDISLGGSQTPTTSVNEVLSAGGRLYVLDGTDLKYSDLLDETQWNGVIDLSTVWWQGGDQGTALAEFNGRLIVFGKDSVIIYDTAYDPSNAAIVENIGGIGAWARDSVQNTGDDLLFLSKFGVQSLGRVVQEKSGPLGLINNTVTDEIISTASLETLSKVKSAFHKKFGWYILSFPTRNKAYVFNLRNRLENGWAKVTKWSISLYSIVTRKNQDVIAGRSGYFVKYQDYKDDVDSDGTGGSSYRFKFLSGWSFLHPQLQTTLKFIKHLGALIRARQGGDVILSWEFDFSPGSGSSKTTTLPSISVSEYNNAEYNVDEYNDVAVTATVDSPGKNSGFVIRLGLQNDINGAVVAIHDAHVGFKPGKSMS